MRKLLRSWRRAIKRWNNWKRREARPQFFQKLVKKQPCLPIKRDLNEGERRKSRAGDGESWTSRFRPRPEKGVAHIRERLRVTGRSPNPKMRGAVCASDTHRASLVQTAPGRLGALSCQLFFHTASNSRLRSRTSSCFSASLTAEAAFSSKSVGKTSNGYGVTHAKAAASFAAFRT
jgi:hypothetical protein